MDLPDSVICERRTYTDKCQTHSHPYGQLILPLQGNMSIKTNMFDFELDDKSLFFLPPDFTHSFYGKSKNEFLVLDIPTKLFYTFGVKTLNRELYQVFDERWKAIRYLMLQETDNSSLTDLVRYSGSLLFQRHIPASIQFIHENFHQQLTVECLASIEHFNVSYYCKWFYKQMEMTPNAYIQRIRLEKAKELLETTELSLLEIALQVGYSHQSSLTRLFRKIEGLNPILYRKRHF
ncbi:AraC family transcriptional regulator [Desulfosporosinus sp. PR]|uniref:AraC family transcriptional regulator n=1 Tax=Candidatus Desulfosporosinus nitrosoreducens TaxID=3401928 RepID=UPI0027FD0B9B|nr:AraC family transcriptional regulator [Desulfosporosinus sp. PR]MDQ7096855.1 AraC family transcriptional regulator [Desulfosporosinus sp. PR]